MKSFLTLLLVAGVLLTLPSCDLVASGEDVTVTATVTNAFGHALQEASVSFGSACTEQSEADGTIQCTLPEGTYEVTIAVPGYITKTLTVTVSSSGRIDLPPLSGDGVLDAQVINALTGQPVPNSAVECKRVLASGFLSGIEWTATTSADGQIVLSGLFLGEADCVVRIDGVWIPFRITLTDNTTGTLAATPPPAEGTFRIVLSWGETPSDLDSHITGPDGSGGRFHVYYSNQTFGDTMLDLDDTSSFGPETITLVPTGDGMYRYAVHNYSRQDGTGAQGIYESPATVRVYDGNGLLRTYTAPEPTAANDGETANTWCVFEMTINGSSVTFNGNAPNGVGYMMASSSGDTGTFLTGGGDASGVKSLAF